MDAIDGSAGCLGCTTRSSAKGTFSLCLARTLLPIIQRVVAPGTTIWSDEWCAYAGLAGLGYVHQMVNHSQNFTDPVSGVCTNHVEAYWCAVKRWFKRMVGTFTADLLGGRNCWCQTEQSPLAVIPAGNCKIPAGVSRAATNHVAAAEFSHASNFKGHAV